MLLYLKSEKKPVHNCISFYWHFLLVPDLHGNFSFSTLQSQKTTPIKGLKMDRQEATARKLEKFQASWPCRAGIRQLEKYKARKILLTKIYIASTFGIMLLIILLNWSWQKVRQDQVMLHRHEFQRQGSFGWIELKIRFFINDNCWSCKRLWWRFCVLRRHLYRFRWM